MFQSDRVPRVPRLALALPLVVMAAGAVLAAPEPRVIDVAARRFAFEPSEIQVAVGEPVRLRVHSEDGLHGFAIKKLKINKDIPRGGDVVLSSPPRWSSVCRDSPGRRVRLRRLRGTTRIAI